MNLFPSMNRARVHGSRLGPPLAVALGLVGCTGGTSAPATKASVDDLPTERLAESWPVRFATVESFAPYQSKSWINLVQRRDYRDAASGLEGLGAARAHADVAALYRQAALLSANAAIETYAETPEETDPIGAAHLLAVAWSVRADGLGKAREASARLDSVTDDVTLPWHAPWKSWLSGPATWPPDLAGLPLELPPVDPSTWPDLGSLPHYRMPVRSEGDHAQPMGDPGSLIALSLWHQAAAEMAAGDQRASVPLVLARYALPVEPRPADAELPMEFLYASDLLVNEDALFLADLSGSGGAAAVDRWADASKPSPMAQFARMSRVEGKIDAERAVDVAGAVRDAVLKMASEATANDVQLHQRMFADITQVAVLRNLALVAEEEGNREQGGKLRILAMELSQDHTGCPVALMSLGAWDAGNRYPMRAQEIIHRAEKTYPALEAARYGLDVLALRVSRERVETPGI